MRGLFERFKFPEIKPSRIREVRGYENFVRIVPKLFSKAENLVWMSTSLYPDFYNRDNVREAVEKAAYRVEDFRMLIDNMVDEKERLSKIPWLKKLIKEGKIKIKKAAYEIRHIIIIDKKIVRIEEYHPANRRAEGNLLVEDPLIILIEATLFNRWWRDARDLDV